MYLAGAVQIETVIAAASGSCAVIYHTCAAISCSSSASWTPSTVSASFSVICVCVPVGSVGEFWGV